MKMRDVVQMLTEAVPESDCWARAGAEPYGAFNVQYASKVQSVLYCVTPSDEIVRYFHEQRYDLLVSHHPFVMDVPQVVLHTALDCCKGGLNDQFREALGIENPRHFDHKLGWYGKIQPIGFDALCTKLEGFLDRQIIGQKYNTLKQIESVVVCTGLGGMVNELALKSGADCYILGEAVGPAEHSEFPAMIETGHTNSEWIGVRLFQKLFEPHGIRIDPAPPFLDRFHGEVYKPRRCLFNGDAMERVEARFRSDEVRARARR